MPRPRPLPMRDPSDDLWRLADGVQERINAADAKIGITTGMELGVLTATAALASTRSPASAPPVALALLAAALAVQLAAILTALSALIPRLRPRPGGPPGSLLYFGTLRTLTPQTLAVRLRRADLLAELSRQVVTISAIAWVKHTRLRVSLRLAGVGIVLAAGAVLALS